jgi:propionyl-CoA synthetase
MRSIADSEPWTMPATIDDAGSLDDVTIALRSLGYANEHIERHP